MRGLQKKAGEEWKGSAPRCAAMAVGSVPHTDVRTALDLILRSTPDIPAWPQMPRRSFLENMYVQFSEGLPGVVIEMDAERIYVRNEVSPEALGEFMEALESGDNEAFAISEPYAAGLRPAAEGLKGSSASYVKGQITGPVSFGLSVAKEDKRAVLYDDTLRDVLTQLLVAKARYQADLFAEWSPSALPLIMVDEPYLTQLGSAFVSIPADLAFPALEACMDAIKGLAGIHVCGGTDWDRITELPVDVLNFDAADYLDALVARREGVAAFVADGGILAWGVVPNDERALEWTAEETGRRILEGAEALAETGDVGVDDVLEMSFVSPACGTGSLPVDVAEGCFSLTADTSAWLRARMGE